MEDSVRQEAENGNVDFLGKKSSAEVHELLRGARVLIVPSIWHEAGVPLVIGEAFSAGVPVICCSLEPIVSVVKHEENGLLIPPNDQNALVDAITRIHADDTLHEKMRRNARMTYERLYQPEPNIQQLLQVYADAAAHRRRLAAI
jgi:glycosyltransferase involved in cell wall biosynthesis